MPYHEHYREICAAASIGQATPEELFDLERHTEHCDGCRQAYFDYLNLAAERFVAAKEGQVVSREVAQESVKSELLIRRFFERAEQEGIPFSQAVGREMHGLTPPTFRAIERRSWRIPIQAIAAVLIVAITGSIGFVWRRQRQSTPRPTTAVAAALNSKNVPVAEPLDRRIEELTISNQKLEEDVERLKLELARSNGELRNSQTNQRTAAEDRAQLVEARTSLEIQLKAVQQELRESQTSIAAAQQAIANQVTHTKQIEEQLTASRIKIDDLNDQLIDKSALLDKERQLLALGHDVSDLMGARNLHIVDVVDTDPKGKTRPAFGRVFFTEGKSLVFYAYDLNEPKLQKANYQYRIWAKQEGVGKQVRNLGIFYSDDKSQRRWVFKCEDPTILSVIDSVFVTLEPADADPTHPNGQNLMYAYLRGQPNHP